MQGFMKGIEITKSWWRIMGILMMLGVFFLTMLIGYGAYYLYEHLVWVA